MPPRALALDSYASPTAMISPLLALSRNRYLPCASWYSSNLPAIGNPLLLQDRVLGATKPSRAASWRSNHRSLARRPHHPRVGRTAIARPRVGPDQAVATAVRCATTSPHRSTFR